MNVYFRNWVVCMWLLVTSFTFSHSFAQANKTTDSLKIVLAQSIPDTQKINILIQLALETECKDSVIKLTYANTAKEYADKIHWINGMIRSNIALGNIYYGCTINYAKAVKYYLITDSLAGIINDRTNQILARSCIAFYYQKTGQYRQAIDYYRLSLTLNPAPDEELGIWGNLGVEYNSIGDYNQALGCYYNSLKILDQLQKIKKSNDVQNTMPMAALLLNIGDTYLEMAQLDKAFENYDSVYKTGVAINNPRLQVLGLMSIGKTYQAKNNYEQSIGYYENALKI